MLAEPDLTATAGTLLSLDCPPRPGRVVRLLPGGTVLLPASLFRVNPLLARLLARRDRVPHTHPDLGPLLAEACWLADRWPARSWQRVRQLIRLADIEWRRQDGHDCRGK